MERLSFFTLAFLTCFSAVFFLSPSPYHALSLSKLPNKSQSSRFKEEATLREFYDWARINYFYKTSSPSTEAKSEKPSLDARYYVSVGIGTSSHHFTVSSRYLSISVSPKRVAGPVSINWDENKLQVIARSLSPAWLRIGGAEADYLTFISPNATTLIYNSDDDSDQDELEFSGHRISQQPDTNPADSIVDPVALEMHPYQWDQVHKFAKRVGWKVMFTLNVQLRDGQDWDVSNATSLVQYSREKKYSILWELGNEPTQFSALPNTTPISPEQLACDFDSLKNMLMTNSGRVDFIAGPAISSPKDFSQTQDHENKLTNLQYLQRFLSTGQQYGRVVNAVTWHQYYVNSSVATMDQFTSPYIMDLLHREALLVQQVTNNFSLPMWLGETGDTSNGAVDGLTNTYAAGFLFMDKLGLAAALKVQVVMHQTLIGLRGLLGSDLSPLPTYWIAVLHKKLVGNKVLLVQNGLTSGRKARIYAHCTKHHIKPSTIVPNYSYGDVTLLVVNTYNYPVNLVLLDELNRKNKDVYILLPLDYSLKSSEVKLNGTKLKLNKGGKPPQFFPECVRKNEDVVVPALSYGFIVIKNARVKACMKY